ncbi:sulfite exporter TauE/SafE family protein [Halovulum sp. GXIMD14794]
MFEMPPDFASLLLAGSAGLFLAAVLRRVIGFGFAMVSVGVLSLMIPPAEAVGVTLLLSLVLGARNVPMMRADASWPLVGRLVISGCVGVPVALLVMSEADEASLRVLIALAIMASLIPMIRKPLAVSPALRWPVAAAGALAGMLNAIAAAPAPPLVYYMMARSDISLEARRASLIAIFTMLAALTVTARLFAGAMPVHSLWIAACLIPAALAGDFSARGLPAVHSRRVVDALSVAVVLMVSVLLALPVV